MSNMALKVISEEKGSRGSLTLMHPMLAYPLQIHLFVTPKELLCNFCNPVQSLTVLGFVPEFHLWYAPEHMCQTAALGKLKQLFVHNTWVKHPEEL